jgi:hypothetical protein
VQDLPVRRTEIAGHIASLLLAVRNPKGADFLVGRHEMSVEESADLFIRKSVRTERLGIVSGKSRLFKVAGDVQDESQLASVLREAIRFRRVSDKIDARTQVVRDCPRR